MPQQQSVRRTLRGTYTVAPGDPFLAGHFPGFPLVPGLFLTQYLIGLVSAQEALDPAGPVLLEKARFRRPVQPGTPVGVEAEVLRDEGTVQVSAALTADSVPVADVRLRFGGRAAGHIGARTEGASPPDTPPAADIESVIPHRGPALLVDAVTRIEPSRLIRTRAAAREVPALGASSVFPPGLLLESWAQSAVALACWTRPNPRVTSGLVTLLAGVRKARLLAPVPLGAVLEHECVVVRDLGDTVITSGTCHADGRPVLEVEQLTLALRAAGTLVSATPVSSRSTNEGA
ncbi:3-hydroxyacyl-ACP dehydratase FabZ family protein [Streptomyces sp. NPDC048305]|uniref:3-hydroxyacyl-ACP dehydratase FabZ family protein n=1 Tax=Streptomyces sp. NPDC048305 TaxID=3365532 RepID=UPI003712F6BC